MKSINIENTWRIETEVDEERYVENLKNKIKAKH